MSTLSINKENFQQEVLKASQPVLIDFWAPWCGPCKMFSPVIDEIAEEQKEKVKVAKINIEEEPELAREFHVMSIPTLILVKDGKAAARSVGARPKHEVEQMLLV